MGKGAECGCAVDPIQLWFDHQAPKSHVSKNSRRNESIFAKVRMNKSFRHRLVGIDETSLSGCELVAAGGMPVAEAGGDLVI